MEEQCEMIDEYSEWIDDEWDGGTRS